MEVLTLLLVWAFVLVIVGAGTDFRWREVPDWLNYSALAIGIFTRICASLFFHDWTFILDCIFGVLLAFIISWVMFNTGQWGGGDAKMLIALGAILGLHVSFSLPIISLNDAFIAFLINTILCGAVFGIGWTIITAVIQRKIFLHELDLLRKEHIVKLAKRISFISSASILIVAFLSPFDIKLPLFALAVFIPFITYLAIAVKAVEKGCMTRRVPPSRLTEGDWIVNDVVINKKRITGPSDLGVSLGQIRILRKFAEKGKIKYVTIKEGMPFVPSFALALLAYALFGNVLLLLTRLL